MISSKPNYLLKATPPNTIPLGVRVSTFNFGGDYTSMPSITVG